MSRTVHNLARKMRQRRDEREFDRAFRSASPAMQQELMAAAVRKLYR
jgi:hypothetical protein